MTDPKIIKFRSPDIECHEKHCGPCPYCFKVSFFDWRTDSEYEAFYCGIYHEELAGGDSPIREPECFELEKKEL